MSARTYEESLGSIDERIARLRARRRDEVARHEKRERSARNYACMAIGDAVLTWFGDWHALDPGAFGRMLRRIAPRREELLRVKGDVVPSTRDALAGYRALRYATAASEDGADGEPREAAPLAGDGGRA